MTQSSSDFLNFTGCDRHGNGVFVVVLEVHHSVQRYSHIGIHSLETVDSLLLENHVIFGLPVCINHERDKNDGGELIMMGRGGTDNGLRLVIF